MSSTAARRRRPAVDVEGSIILVRSARVMLDADLA
jgi:hypothetical protein